MKSMSLVQYAREVQTATTLPARASLYVRSLGLRYGLWKTARDMERTRQERRANRQSSIDPAAQLGRDRVLSESSDIEIDTNSRAP